MSQSIDVVVNDKLITISKLPLGAYADVFGALEKIPQTLSEFFNAPDKGTNDNSTDRKATFDGASFTETFVSKLPHLIQVALPELAKVISIATHGQLTEEQVIKEVGLDEAVEIVAAIINVNNIAKVIDNVKKMFSPTPSEKPKATGSIERLTSSPANTNGPSGTYSKPSIPTNS